MELTALDRQMGDLVWSFYNGLRAGYSTPQVLDMLSREAPEPARGACKSLFEDLLQSVPMAEALEKWKQAYPSPLLAQVAEKMMEQQRAGGHLADLLVPLEAEFIRQAGSDPAFYEAMRTEAKQIGASLPERAVMDG